VFYITVRGRITLRPLMSS